MEKIKFIMDQIHTIHAVVHTRMPQMEHTLIDFKLESMVVEHGKDFTVTMMAGDTRRKHVEKEHNRNLSKHYRFYPQNAYDRVTFNNSNT